MAFSRSVKMAGKTMQHEGSEAWRTSSMSAGEEGPPVSSGLELVVVKTEDEASVPAMVAEPAEKAVSSEGIKVEVGEEIASTAVPSSAAGGNSGVVVKEEVKQEDSVSASGIQDAARRVPENAGPGRPESADRGRPEAAPALVTIVKPPPQLGPPLTEKERRARERIELDQYDVEAWVLLGNEAQSRSVADAIPIYEAIIANFPTSAVYWKKYVELQMGANNDDAVKQIFSRCLRNCLSVDLWKSYIRFVRKVNESRGPEGREEMKKAYEFMLDHVGSDISAGSVWQEYISFLKGAVASTPHEESQRMTSVRKAYQRAVLAPVHLVEQLWKDYESFENSVSRALAKGLFTEYQPKHFSARAVYKERKKYCERIDQTMLPVPPTGSSKEEQQCLAWRQLLQFEKGNPQRLDPAALTKRVAFTYEQCLMFLYHFPDVWFDFATWHAQNGLPDQAAAIFQRALKALPDSAVLHFASAEFEEARGNYKEAKKVYESLLRNTSSSDALSYIQFMRFVRRTEGIDEARKVFLQARKAPACTYQVYVASAIMELCVDKDPKVARNIFELGLKKYIHEPAYVLEYADFLDRMNDDKNVRVLFERALSVLPPDESLEVWNRYLELEAKYEDLQSILKVEQRKREALASIGEETSEGALQQLISRYRFRDLWPCSTSDLDHLTRQQLMAQRASQKMEKPGAISAQPEKGMNGSTGASESQTPAAPTLNLARPDVSKMALYDPRQGYGGAVPVQVSSQILQGPLPPGIVSAQGSAGHNLQMRPSNVTGGLPPRPSGSQTLPAGRPSADAAFKPGEESLKYLPATLASFVRSLPHVPGPYPEPEIVMSVLMQADLKGLGAQGAHIHMAQGGGSGLQSTDHVGKSQGGANGITRLGLTSGGGLTQTGMRQARQSHQQKRKEIERQEDEDDVPAAPSKPATSDLFRLRQMQRARAASSGASGPTGSTSGGSGAFSGEPSGSSN